MSADRITVGGLRAALAECPDDAEVVVLAHERLLEVCALTYSGGIGPVAVVAE